jgi:alpha-L-fucosidase
MLYLHFFDWPSEPVPLCGLKTTVHSALLFGSTSIVKVRTGRDPFSDGTVQTVQLPRQRPSDIDSVVALRFDTVPDVVDPGVLVTQSADGSIVLKAFDANIRGTEAKYEGRGTRGHIGSWTNPEDYVEWTMVLNEGGTFDVEVTYACEPDSAGAEYELIAGDRKLSGLASDTGSWKKFQTKPLGRIRLQPGRYTLTVKPKTVPHGAVMNLRQIKLAPR